MSLVTVSDQICHLHQPGGTSLSPHQLQQTVNMAIVAVKKRRLSYRQSKVRRRAARSSVFPDVFSSSPRQVGENLAQWEASLSSDENHPELSGSPGPPECQIKYIPVNYFEYFDNADLDSDQFSQMTTNLLPRPPPLPLAEVAEPEAGGGQRSPHPHLYPGQHHQQDVPAHPGPADPAVHRVVQPVLGMSSRYEIFIYVY